MDISLGGGEEKGGAKGLDLILTKECMDPRTSSRSLGDVVIPNKARPALSMPQGNGGTKSWCNAMSQLFSTWLGDPEQVPSLLWVLNLFICKRRGGPEGLQGPFQISDDLIRHLIMILHSFFQVTLGLEFSNTP